MVTTSTFPLIRVFRAARGETLEEARLRRPELVTFDTTDLLTVVTRCQTSLSKREVEALRATAKRIPPGAVADVLLAPGGRVRLEVHEGATGSTSHDGEMLIA